MDSETNEGSPETGDEATVAVGSDSQVRGSSLLLAGRFLAIGVNYGTQILIIRYLSKSDYGAFAYALSLVLVVQAFIQLGLDRGLSRFLPIYDEERDPGAVVGSLGFVALTTFGLGMVAASAVWFAGGFIGDSLGVDPLATSVLAILIVLAPIDGLDNILVTSLAALHQTKAIFFRRYVVGPALRLSAVLALILIDGDVVVLAIGYAAAGLLGLLIFGIGLVKLLRRRWSDGARLRVPVRALVVFSLPLLTTDLVFIVMTASDALMLEWFGDTSDVAAIRAVQPTAKLGQSVLAAFGILYVPYIARLYARSRFEDVGARYWRTVSWIVLLSAPLVVMTMLFSDELTGGLLGGEYRDSAVILGVLTLGYFSNALFGFNGMTLNVYNRVRELVVLNVVAMTANLALNVALIPSFGPLGAACGTAGTILVHNVAKERAVLRLEGLHSPPAETRKIYWLVGGMVIFAIVFGYVVPAGFAIRVGILLAACLATVAMGRAFLDLEETFPELARIPVVRRLLT